LDLLNKQAPFTEPFAILSLNKTDQDTLFVDGLNESGIVFVNNLNDLANLIRPNLFTSRSVC